MTRTYKKEDAMLRPEHESTLEKQQKARNKPKSPYLEVSGKGDILNRKINERVKRRDAIEREMNKVVKDPF